MEQSIYRREDGVFVKFITYLIAMLFIINNGTVYTHMVGVNHLDSIATYAIVPLMLICLFVNVSMPKRAISTCLIVGAYLGVYVVLSGANIRIALPEIVLVIAVLAYYLTIEVDSSPKVLIAYRNIIFAIALVSLFFWLFGSILNVIHSTGTVVSNWGAMGSGSTNNVSSYYGVYFELDRTYIFGEFITCNRAIFVERAFASFSFGIGWIYELFIERNKSKIRLVVFVLSILSTLAMTGLIILVITFALYFVFGETHQKLIRVFKILIVPVVIEITVYVVSYLLQTKMSMGHSYSSRMNDFINGFAAWSKSIWWGYGFGNSEYIHQMFKTGYSNSISAILTQGGIMLIAPYVYCFYKGISHGVKKKNTERGLFAIVFLLSFSFTAVAFINIVIYLLIYMRYGNYFGQGNRVVNNPVE